MKIRILIFDLLKMRNRRSIFILMEMKIIDFQYVDMISDEKREFLKNMMDFHFKDMTQSEIDIHRNNLASKRKNFTEICSELRFSQCVGTRFSYGSVFTQPSVWLSAPVSTQYIFT